MYSENSSSKYINYNGRCRSLTSAVSNYADKPFLRDRKVFFFLRHELNSPLYFSCYGKAPAHFLYLPCWSSQRFWKTIHSFVQSVEFNFWEIRHSHKQATGNKDKYISSNAIDPIHFSRRLPARWGKCRATSLRDDSLFSCILTQFRTRSTKIAVTNGLKKYFSPADMQQGLLLSTVRSHWTFIWFFTLEKGILKQKRS